jgi:hypothetical protein
LHLMNPIKDTSDPFTALMGLRMGVLLVVCQDHIGWAIMLMRIRRKLSTWATALSIQKVHTAIPHRHIVNGAGCDSQIECSMLSIEALC